MDLSQEFQRLEGTHYLDHAGATLYSEKQLQEVMRDFCSSVYGNPHSLNTISKHTSDIVDQIRFRILHHFNTNMDEYDVIFTSGATAALKLVAESFNFGDAEKGAFVYAQENHTSVLGMREVVVDKCSSTISLSSKKISKLFSVSLNPSKENENYNNGCASSLFVYPAQCNYSGVKNPLSWVGMTQAGVLENATGTKSRWACLLDAASLVATSSLDLSVCKPDFVAISFYKIFGYPSGLGALLVRNSSSQFLSAKKYFGGGTVLIAFSHVREHKVRPILHERFEDGTLPFLSVIAVGHGLDTVARLAGPMEAVKMHTFSLARRAHHSLKAIRHYNGCPVVILYCDNDFEDPDTQGPIVNFNLLQSDGKHVGYNKVLIMANSHKIHLRTGCFCNPGACQRHLGLTADDLHSHFEAGHVCGDQNDLVDGVPTGSVRISFGYMSTEADVDAVLKMVYQCFVDHGPLTVLKNEGQDEEWYDASDDAKPKDSEGKDTSISELRLSEVVLYPIKSCGGFKPNSAWAIGPRGLIYDRTWMIVTASGTALTQSLEPRLALVRPHINLSNRELQLNFSGEPDSITVPLDETDTNGYYQASLCESRVCGDRIRGIDCGEEAAAWLSAHLGRHGLRLLRQLNRNGRNDKKKSLALSNKAQFLLVSEKSVSWLAEQIEPGECEMDGLVDRFRANIVVRGQQFPFDELDWKEIKIGTQRFTVDGPCTRCGVVCVDQATGKRTNEPLRTLSKINQKNVHFGMYLTHQPDGDDDGIGLISPGNLIQSVQRQSSR